MASILEELAEQEDASISMIANQLILEALEKREDIVLSRLAELRDKPDQRFVSHEDAWK